MKTTVLEIGVEPIGRIPYGGPVYQIENVLEKLDNDDYRVLVVFPETGQKAELKLSQLKEKSENKRCSL